MQDKKKQQANKANTIGNFEDVINLAVEKAKTKPAPKKLELKNKNEKRNNRNNI